MKPKITMCFRFTSNLIQKRCESTVTSLKNDEMMMLLKSSVMTEAEKVVGYPTSLTSSLLSEEFVNMSLYIRKLVDNNHQVIQIAKDYVYGDKTNLRPWGLAILLLSKSVNKTLLNSSSNQRKTIEEKQLTLAKVTEMYRIGNLIHKGIINLSFLNRSKDFELATTGNKFALLLGDYILVTANGMLASLRNQDVNHMVSSGLRDLSEGVFFGDRDEQNMPLPGKPNKCIQNDIYDLHLDTKPLSVEDVLGNPKREWTVRSMFNGARLFGRGCQGAMLLGHQSLEVQNSAYYFGCHLGLAWQADSELQKLTSDSKEHFCLASAPVLFALDGNTDLYKIIDQAKRDVKDIDYEDLKFNILKTEAVDRTKRLYEEHKKKAADYMEAISQNESNEMLKKFVNIF